jgi:hypothetical protein
MAGPDRIVVPSNRFSTRHEAEDRATARSSNKESVQASQRSQEGWVLHFSCRFILASRGFRSTNRDIHTRGTHVAIHLDIDSIDKQICIIQRQSSSITISFFFLCPVVRIESDHMRHVPTSFSAPLRAGSPCDLDTGSHAIQLDLASS